MINGNDALFGPLHAALALASVGVPALPLRQGKVPFGNCPTCTGNQCGGRPNMKIPGSCACPMPCHGWAASSSRAEVISSDAWSTAWTKAAATAYHPGGANLTVVDLDNADAVTWARGHLPATRTVETTRGQHWIYLGAMQSANAVRPGVDIKSLMAYARWLGPGDGLMVKLPDSVRALTAREEATGAGSSRVPSALPARAAWDRQVASGCRHTERYVRTGLERGLDMLRPLQDGQGRGRTAWSVARHMGRLHAQCPGPCGLENLGDEIVNMAIATGLEHWRAIRAVQNGFAASGMNVPMGQAA
ncbi:hypothetical protein C9F11_08830 [Streptomyces sp. YIM 121038]|uniref:bifunctional DNA primase/polymerase n=1 Tax=Streptomyces sp. YIM 121038 TaxID=2136401 RepID=UPI0011106E8F|nr:bifunctional DNA primase/polymerase [Streptomyces sp. YIM 121038]QCX75455.1 hypothetical protein C9F11_08830 [Streptomyces sp. YIM 121038]